MHMHARNQIREILLLRELHNENIVSLKDVFLSGTPQHAQQTTQRHHNATTQKQRDSHRIQHRTENNTARQMHQQERQGRTLD